MTQLLSRVESGEIALNAESVAESADFAPISNPAAEYPTLLYDGPFSDGATGDRYRALEGMNAVTRDEAEKRCARISGMSRRFISFRRAAFRLKYMNLR